MCDWTRLLISSHIENKKAGVALQGHSGQKTTFSGTSMSGMSVIRVAEVR
jgi:hypothetical protein